jgi:DMSO/TMAO reductase YedYZ molybdopterin-dependent catalytic subunit
VTLPPERGFPFQVVAESKWGYKWVKWVTKIELSDDTDYKGYWEELGYNNDGGIEGPIFEK